MVYKVSPSVEDLLPLLFNIQNSSIFQTLWEMNGKLVHKSIANRQRITTEDVAQKIWQPAWFRLNKIKESLVDLSITLLDVNKTFRLFEKEEERKSELIFLNQGNEEPWINECLKKMNIYRRLGEFRDGALAVINAAKVLDWHGDLKILRAIIDMVNMILYHHDPLGIIQCFIAMNVPALETCYNLAVVLRAT